MILDFMDHSHHSSLSGGQRLNLQLQMYHQPCRMPGSFGWVEHDITTPIVIRHSCPR